MIKKIKLLKGLPGSFLTDRFNVQGLILTQRFAVTTGVV